MLSSVCLTVLSFISQCALGWLLVPEDFGLFALAAGLVTMFQVMRDAGVSVWLARQTPEELAENQRAAFWLIAVAASMVTGALMVLGPTAAKFYGLPELCNLVWILACAMLVDALSIVPEAHMQVRFRFRALSILRILCGLTRYLLAVGLAYVGWRAYSLVMPVVFMAFVRFTFTYGLTGLRPWQRGCDLSQCSDVFRQCRWAMLGTLAYALLGQIDYLMLGLVSSVSVVGIYFFAYQICYQPVMLVAQSIRGVIIPTFSRVEGNVQRSHGAAARGIRFIAVLGTLSIVYVALSIEYMERLIWHGEWIGAVLPVQIMSLAMPIHLLADVSAMMTQSRGKFRTVAMVIALRGFGLGATVLAAGWTGRTDDPTVVAAVVAGYLSVSGLVGSAYLFRALQLPVMKSIKEFVLPYAAIVIIVVLVLVALDHFHLAVTLGNLAFSTVVFLVTSICVVWLLFPDHKREVMQTVRLMARLAKSDSSTVTPH